MARTYVRTDRAGPGSPWPSQSSVSHMHRASPSVGRSHVLVRPRLDFISGRMCCQQFSLFASCKTAKLWSQPHAIYFVWRRLIGKTRPISGDKLVVATVVRWFLQALTCDRIFSELVVRTSRLCSCACGRQGSGRTAEARQARRVRSCGVAATCQRPSSRRWVEWIGLGDWRCWTGTVPPSCICSTSALLFADLKSWEKNAGWKKK
jgi:hypothetical protein